MKLGGIDGWAVLDQLKRNPATRHIPVQVVSVMDRQQGTALGAISYLEKPVSGEALAGAFAHMTSFIERDIRELLIVEDDDVQRNSIIELISNGGDVHVAAVENAEDALTELGKNQYDCVVLDLSLPGMGGLDLLKQIKQQPGYLDLPIIIYTSKDLSRQEEAQLKKYAVSIITKNATSSERLLDETALFLHRIVANLPEGTRKVVEQLHPAPESTVGAAPNGRASMAIAREPAPKPAARAPKGGRAKKGTGAAVDLNGRKVLIVDDDYRNIFALTSMLETYGLTVAFAESGKEGIDLLQNDPAIELVFMDIMMPDMDGYQTMQAIRGVEQFQDLPIVALTAKAMDGDREKCLNAGATDYITKPVDIEQLLVMLRELLGKTRA